MLEALAHARHRGEAGGRRRRGDRRGRRVSGQGRRAVSRQRRHRVPAADRGAGAMRRRLSSVGRGAHARAADRRSGRCAARPGRRHRLPWCGGISAAAHQARNDQGGRKSERARRRIEPVPDCAADGFAAHRPADHHRRRGRADFQALCGDHAEHDAPLRRRGRARGLGRIHHCRGRALPQPGRTLGGGRRLVGFLLSRGGRHRRRAGARRGRGARQRSRRCALRRSPRANGRAHRHGRELDRGQRAGGEPGSCAPSMPTSITFPMRR